MSDTSDCRDIWYDMTTITSEYEVQVSCTTAKVRHRPRQAYGPVGYLRKDGPVADLPWTPGWPPEKHQK